MRRVLNCFTFFLVSIALSGCVGVGGEKIALMHDQLNQPTNQRSETLNLRQPIDDLRDDKEAIGNATFTLFAIPSGSINTVNGLSQELTEQIKQALESIGYKINLVESDKIPMTNNAVVRIVVNEFWFRNYNYFWPVVPSWGTIKLRLIVERSENKRAFDQEFVAEGNSFCLEGECAFESATTEAMTKLLNQVIAVCSGEEFYLALVSE